MVSDERLDVFEVVGFLSGNHNWDLQFFRSQSIEDEQLVFSWFDGTHVQQEMVGKPVLLLEASLLRFGGLYLELGSASLIHHFDLVGVDVGQLHQVAFGLLAHGDDAVGDLAAVQVFFTVHHAVESREEFRMLDEQQVVHGDHGANCGFFYA